MRTYRDGLNLWYQEACWWDSHKEGRGLAARAHPTAPTGSRAWGAAPDSGTGHQPGVRDGTSARVGTQM